MSKIYLKTSTTPLFVERRIAEGLKKDFLNQSKKPTEFIEIRHALGVETCVFAELRSFSLNTDEDYYLKLKDIQNNSKFYEPKAYFGTTWLDKQAKLEKHLKPAEKVQKLGFPRIVWDLFRHDKFDLQAYQRRAMGFFEENPGRIFCDVDVIVGVKTKTAHNIAELAVLNVIFNQIKNDKHFSKTI